MTENYNLYRKSQNRRKLINLFFAVFLLVSTTVGFEIFNQLNKKEIMRKEEIEKLLINININIDLVKLRESLDQKTIYTEEVLEQFPIYIMKKENDSQRITIVNQTESEIIFDSTTSASLDVNLNENKTDDNNTNTENTSLSTN